MARYSYLRVVNRTGGVVQPETIVNLVAGGALAAFLAKLLQAQYEARIADFKERITEQSSLLGKMGDGLETLTAKADTLADAVERLERQLAAQHPGKGD